LLRTIGCRRLIKQSTDIGGVPDNNFVGMDRLASVINDGTPGRTFYLPYGEELTASANDRIKFATYTRDGSTGLDYADQLLWPPASDIVYRIENRVGTFLGA
jgi:hypothetical protein